jgi:flagellar biosynthesis protein FlhF
VKEGGLFNSKFLAKEVVELTAAIPERGGSKARPEKKSTIDFMVGDTDAVKAAAAGRGTPPPKEEGYADTLKKTLDSLSLNQAHENTARQDKETPVETKAPPEDVVEVSREKFAELKRFEKEFHEIKSTLNRLIEAQGKDTEKRCASASEEDQLLKPYREILKNNDFGDEECHSILEEVRNSISREDLKDKYKIEKTLKDLMKSRIVTSGPLKKGSKKKIIMFIGPTGVGKTTTMAKLGAIYALREGRSVAFITIDNYRIAATEQLKKYAEIMKIPIHVVNDQKSFKEVIDREKAEIIMIDTSGRSHRNELKISEIKSYAEVVEYDFEKILCISANTKKVDLNDVFKAFDKIHFNSVIITKVDETSFVGNVVDVADKYKKPISYYTNGQEVPNDIAVADPDNLVNLMMGSLNNG